MKKTRSLFIALAMGIALASCGNNADGDGSTARDSTEMGPSNKADSPADTAVLVEDPNNKLGADPINDTTVHVDANQKTVK